VGVVLFAGAGGRSALWANPNGEDEPALQAGVESAASLDRTPTAEASDTAK